MSMFMSPYCVLGFVNNTCIYRGFRGGSDGKELACNVGDLG